MKKTQGASVSSMAMRSLWLLLAFVFVVATEAFLPSLLSPAGRLYTVPARSPASGLTRVWAEGEAGGVGGPVDACRQKIAEALKPVQLIVKSHNDDPNGSHIAVKVVSPLFEGKNRVQRQQMVYKAIWEEMQGPIHAVDELVCKTPGEEQS